MVSVYKPAKAVSLISLLAALTACSTISGGNNILPDGGPTTQEVYNGHHNSAAQPGNTSETYNVQRDVQLSRHPGPWTRDAHNEINNLFPRVPNLLITGFVFPHLSPGGHPVPGYSTQFPVYERPHYALPGEAAPVNTVKGVAETD